MSSETFKPGKAGHKGKAFQKKSYEKRDSRERRGENMERIKGGVTAAKGFQAAGVEANVTYKNRKDTAMIASGVT